MRIWRELVSTAIVGTEKQKLRLSPEPNGELSRAVENLELENGDAAALLRAAAVLAVYRQAGWQIERDEQPAPVAAPPETLQPIGDKSAFRLTTMLGGTRGEILPEFFRLAARFKRILPAPLLPQILDLGNARPEYRFLLLPILGERGRWLAGQNEDWRWALVAETATEVWETGNRAERTFALEYLRCRDRDQARELLRRDWKNEAAKDRPALLEKFRAQLSRADEPFLNEVLQSDKSREARRAAFDLCLDLPNSEFQQEIIRRAASFLLFSKGGYFSKPKLEVVFPKDFAIEKTDVLNDLELFLDQRGLGEKAVFLAKLLHCVPPPFWEKHFSAAAETIVDAARQSEWRAALLGGFKSAAIRFGARQWLLTILPESGQNDYYPIVNEIGRRSTGSQIEKLVTDLLDGKMKHAIALQFAALLVYQIEDSWSDEFTRRFFAFLKQYAARETDFDASVFNSLISVLNYSANRISAEFLKSFDAETFVRAIAESGKSSNVGTLAEDFQSDLEFRREMHKSFEE